MAYVEKTKLSNVAGTTINPATEDTLSQVNDKLPTLSGGSVPVTGPLTDAQLRATAVPVSGPLTDTQLRATAVPVTSLLRNSAGTVINPATEDSVNDISEQIVLLRRIAKLLEAQNATDIANRQRITLDSIPAGVTLPAVTTVTTVTTVSTVTAVTGITNALPAGTNNIGSVNLAGADQRQFIDVSRTNYNTGIRAGLTFGRYA